MNVYRYENTPEGVVNKTAPAAHAAPRGNRRTVIAIAAVTAVLVNLAVGVAVYFIYSLLFYPLPYRRDGLTVSYDANDEAAVAVSRSAADDTVEIRCGATYGTGLIMEYRDGYPVILTNYHVIKDAVSAPENIEIKFYGSFDFASGTGTNGDKNAVLGYDADEDAAVFKFRAKVANDGRAGLLGKTDEAGSPVTGQRVIAVGNALGKGLAACDGIVSMPERILERGGKPYSVIQTTAPVNAGNSGGGLFDMNGKLIGITAYQSQSAQGAYVDGISYAVPAKIFMPLYRLFINNIGAKFGASLAYLNGGGGGGGGTVIDAYEIGVKFAFAPEIRGNIEYRVLRVVEPSSDGNFRAGVKIVKINDFTIDAGTEYRDVLHELYGYHSSGTGERLTFTADAGETITSETPRRVV